MMQHAELLQQLDADSRGNNSYLNASSANFTNDDALFFDSTNTSVLATTLLLGGSADSSTSNDTLPHSPPTVNISRLFASTGLGSTATNHSRNDDTRISYIDDDNVFSTLVTQSPFVYLNTTTTNATSVNLFEQQATNMSYVTMFDWFFKESANQTLTRDSNITVNNVSLLNDTCAPITFEQSVQYVTYGICIPLIASIGILVNVASFIVLSRRSMRSSVNVYLAGLSFFDGFLLLSALLMFPSLVHCELARTCGAGSSFAWCRYQDIITQYMYPLMNIMQTGSIYTLIAITIDRFIAITWPLNSRDMLTVSRALKVLAVIAAWSLLYNIPIFFELEFDEDNGLRLTNLRQQPIYILAYKSYCYLFFMFLIPAVLMIVLNGFVTLAVRRAYRIRRQLSGRDEKERRSTLMAVLVVGTFLVLNLTANITNCVEAFEPQAKILVVGFFGNLLVTLNSATNFFIYCALSLRFRQTFCKLFCPFCYTPEKEYQFLSAYFGSGRGNNNNAGASVVDHGGIISMRSLRRPLISSPHHGGSGSGRANSQQPRSSMSTTGNPTVGGNGGSSQSSRKPTMKVDFSQRNKNLVTRRPPAYD